LPQRSLASGEWGLRPHTLALLLSLTDIDLSKCVSSKILKILKNNTEVTNSKCYVFASSALLRLLFTSNFKTDDKYLAPPKIFFAKNTHFNSEKLRHRADG